MIGTDSFVVSNLRKGDFDLRSNWRLQSTGDNCILAEKWAIYSSLIYSDTPDFLYFFFLRRSPVEYFFFLVDPVSLAILWKQSKLIGYIMRVGENNTSLSQLSTPVFYPVFTDMPSHWGDMVVSKAAFWSQECLRECNQQLDLRLHEFWLISLMHQCVKAISCAWL